MFGYGLRRGSINITFMGSSDIFGNAAHIIINYMGKVFIPFKVSYFQDA